MFDWDHDKLVELDDEQVLKLLASEEEIEAFSEFSTPQVQNGTETVPIPHTQKLVRMMQMAATHAVKSPNKNVPWKGKSAKKIGPKTENLRNKLKVR